MMRDAPGTRDPGRVSEAQEAVAGNSSCFRACVEAGLSESLIGLRFRGIGLDTDGGPGVAVPDDSPSAREKPEDAAAELGRCRPEERFSDV